MLKDIKKVERKGKECLIYSSKGMILSLDEAEFQIFRKFGHLEKINEKHKNLLNRLCHYGILEFKNYSPEKVEKIYDSSLLKSNDNQPIYPAPLLAHLAVTNKCNMRCKYCSVRKLNERSGELSTEEWKKIIEKLADWGVYQIGFTGGEPTLRKDLLELAEFVSKKGSVFNLTTNGWFLDEKMVKGLVSRGMKQCQVSMDCHIEEIHDFLRGKGSCKRVIKAINLLKKAGVAVGIDCVVSRNNLKAIPAFIDWLGSKEVPYLTIIKLKKGDLSFEEYKFLLPEYEDYSKLIEYVCKRKNEAPFVTIDCGSVANLQQVIGGEVLAKIQTAGCPIGHTLISIASNGDIYPCAALSDRKFCLGNALKDNPEKIWLENAKLKNFRLIKKKIQGKCKGCERLDLCRGGCRGIAYSFSGEFQSDPTCNFQAKILKGGKTK